MMQRHHFLSARDRRPCQQSTFNFVEGAGCEPPSTIYLADAEPSKFIASHNPSAFNDSLVRASPLNTLSCLPVQFVSEAKMASSKKSSSYDAFSSVDKLVAKPVIGSDGAASWQDFKKETKHRSHHASVAPSIPLKKVDRLAGITSLDQEKKREDDIRKEAGEAAVGEGYTVFRKKNTAEEAAERKKRKQIEQRIRPDDKKYYIQAASFEGWKFDYIFTTRDRGTGYYWDGMDSLKKLKGLISDEYEEDEKVECATGEEGAAQEKPRKKRKKKKAQAPVIVDDPNNPFEQVANAIRKRNEAMNAPPSILTEGLPAGWDIATDPSTNKTYYYCRSNGQRQWDRPTTATATVDTTTIPSALPPGWSVAKDESTGKEYFYHTNGQRQWDRPNA